MKKIFYTLLLVYVAVVNSIAQTNIFPSSGYAGAGTAAPLAQLEVRGGNLLIKNLNNVDGESVPMITQSLSFGSYVNFGTAIHSFTESGGYNSYALQFLTQETHVQGPVEKMRISGNGNVGIGITNPQEKLAVNGKIRAREIKVESTNWPDYVFESFYKPLSLAEVSSFIKNYKHLPEVPSASEVESSGLELGEMSKLLLKKIEELTLHLIEKENELKIERNTNKKQSDEIYTLQKQFRELKEIVEKFK